MTTDFCRHWRSSWFKTYVLSHPEQHPGGSCPTSSARIQNVLLPIQGERLLEIRGSSGKAVLSPMDARNIFLVITVCMVAVALLACGGGKEPLASEECFEYLEWATSMHSEDTSALKPVAERHLEDWSFEEVAIFTEWADAMTKRKIDIEADPCDTFFERMETWLYSEPGQEFFDEYGNWLNTDEGQKYMR